MDEQTFEDGKKEGIAIALRTVLDIIERYKDKESDDLQEDLKNDIIKAFDKILEKTRLVFRQTNLPNHYSSPTSH